MAALSLIREKGHTGQSWQEGDGNENNLTERFRDAEEHLWTHNLKPLGGWATAAEDQSVKTK